MNGFDLIGTVLQDAFWSGLAALGFAILFNVPRHLLAACVVFGALGHAFRTLLTSFGMGIEPATLVAAALVGLTGHTGGSVSTFPRDFHEYRENSQWAGSLCPTRKDRGLSGAPLTPANDGPLLY